MSESQKRNNWQKAYYEVLQEKQTLQEQYNQLAEVMRAGRVSMEQKCWIDVYAACMECTEGYAKEAANDAVKAFNERFPI